METHAKGMARQPPPSRRSDKARTLLRIANRLRHHRRMTILLAGVLLGVTLVVVLAKTGVTKYLEGFWSEVGQDDGRRYSSWRRHRRAGGAGRIEASRAALRASRGSYIPAPDQSARGGQQLGFGLVDFRGPFTDRKPVILVMGSDASPVTEGLRSLLSAWDSPCPVLVLQDGGTSLLYPGTRRYPGDLNEQLRLALADADSEIRSGSAHYVAAILRPPFSGSFTHDGAILTELVETLFAEHRNIAATWLRPVSLLEGNPIGVLQGGNSGHLVDRLTSLNWLPRSEVRNVGSSLRLAESDAVKATLRLLGDPNGFIVSVEDTLPNYDAAIQLVIGTRALREMRARIDTIDNRSALTPVQDLIFSVESASGVEARLVADSLAQMTAYVVSDHGTATPTAAEPLGALRDALERDDEARASMLLSTAGRAWLEREDSGEYLALLHAVQQRFSRAAASSIWSTYLLHLNDMLHAGTPPSGVFSERDVAFATRVGLGSLFRAEAMEAARIGGATDEAATRACQLVPELAHLSDPTGDPAWDYVTGTSMFLVANLLRRGGLYPTAEVWIRAAIVHLSAGPATAAKNTELVHCDYALAVCAAMRGRPILSPLSGRSEGSDLFALGLIALSNGNASWMLKDRTGAQRYAEEASEIFRRLGYSRYSKRARELADNLMLWIDLEAGSPLDRNSRAAALVSTVVGAKVTTLDLGSLRPSRVLGLLSFGRRFGAQDEHRSVLLPRVLDNSYSWQALQPAGSLREADERLRRAMGLELDHPVPLVAD